jgi:cobalt-zinc-cadmium efflux system outer membrane protein
MKLLTRILLMVVAVGLAATGTARAQSPVVAPDGLSIEALVAMAMDRAPMLTAAAARIEVAEGERRQASLRPNPIAGADRREQFGGADTQTTFSLTMPLDLFRRDARVAVADHTVQRAAALAEWERIDRAALVRVRVADLLAAVRQLGVVRQVAQAARLRLDMLRARVDTGAGTPLDRDLADVEWQRTDAEALRWQGQVDAAMAALKAAVGWPIHEPLHLLSSLDEAIAGLPAVPAALAAAAIDRRPDVRAAEAMAGRADAMQHLARREARLDLSVTGAYMWRAVGRERMNEAMVGVMVELPWRNRQQGAIAAAAAEGRAAQADVAALRLDAAGEMAAAVARDTAALATVQRYRSGLVDLAAKNLDVVRERWSLGQGTLFDVIEEERRFLSLQVEYTTALRELCDARATVLRAWGVQS